MLALYVIAAVLAQSPVPQGVQDAGVRLFEQGGFAAVSIVLAVVAAGATWIATRERRASAEAANKLLDFATKAVDNAAQLQASQRENTAALNALAQEVRARGGS